MPKNKDFMRRISAIHEKLSSGNHYTLKELLEACEQSTDQSISEKTLYNDLNDLRELGAPIPRRDRSGFPYYYEEPFSLYGVLNPSDGALANEAVSLLRQMNTLPQFAGLEDVMLQFEQQAGVIGKPRESVVQFEQNKQYKGLKWLQPLYEAIRQDHQILVDYQDFTAKKSTRYTISPALLKESNNRWFLFGEAEDWFAGRPIPLDRIKNITPLPNLRRKSDSTDWTTEFADVVGVTRIEENLAELLVLRVWLPRARYVETKPLHHSQEIMTETSEYLDFQYTLRWNPELVAKIMELGPDAELLEPSHRRSDLAQKVKKMAGHYAP